MAIIKDLSAGLQNPKTGVYCVNQDGIMNSHHLSIEHADHPAESEAKWQKHVMAALWIAFALMITISLALVCVRINGSFQPAHDRPPSALPEGF